MKNQIELLLRTARTNLMMYRLTNTIGYKLHGLRALSDINHIVNNENEKTYTNIIIFQKVA